MRKLSLIPVSEIVATRPVVRIIMATAVFFIAILFPRLSAEAQSAAQVTEVTRTLSPASQTVIERLSTFDNLPAAEWRYHAGDLAHGETLDLDDSSWPQVKARSQAPPDAVWYRRVITVPKTLNGYDLTGSRIWFQFRAGANGPMPQIIYFSGRRVALGDDLEPIVLSEQA